MLFQRFLFLSLTLTCLVSCGSWNKTQIATQPPHPSPPVVEDLGIAPTQTVLDQQSPEETQCLGDQDNPVALGIAAEYDFTTYQQVMEWFCSGAEFEDIMTALETESQSGTPAQEMLVMLADGFSWDEIWQVIGLTE